jgi:hypothetical protein
MKHITLLHLDLTDNVNKTFAVITENKEVIHSSNFDYNDDIGLEELFDVLESAIDIDLSDARLSSVGGGGYKRPVRN